MTKIEGLKLLDYVEKVTKADIGPMYVDQQEANKATVTIKKLIGEPLKGSHVKCGPVIPSHCGGHKFSGKNLVPVVKNPDSLNTVDNEGC